MPRFQLEGEEWGFKFAEDNRPDQPLIEHAAMTLAAKAGITVAEIRAVPFRNGAAVAIRRFDREAGRRVYALSVNVALKAAGVEAPYPSLALLLRRRGVTEVNRAQMHELFRRLVFNILIDNTDDHAKNHVLLVRPNQQYVFWRRLSTSCPSASRWVTRRWWSERRARSRRSKMR